MPEGSTAQGAGGWVGWLGIAPIELRVTDAAGAATVLAKTRDIAGRLERGRECGSLVVRRVRRF